MISCILLLLKFVRSFGFLTGQSGSFFWKLNTFLNLLDRTIKGYSKSKKSVTDVTVKSSGCCIDLALQENIIYYLELFRKCKLF